MSKRREGFAVLKTLYSTNHSVETKKESIVHNLYLQEVESVRGIFIKLLNWSILGEYDIAFSVDKLEVNCGLCNSIKNCNLFKNSQEIATFVKIYIASAK